MDPLELALTVVEADAGTTGTYSALVPADLLLLSGIMGNISTPDIERVTRLPLVLRGESPGEVLCTFYR